MEKISTLSDGKDILKETTHGNLKKIYKMQAKSCKNIFRVYYNQDNFSIELEPRECESNWGRVLQEIPQLNYTMKYVTTYLQEISQRIR